MSDELEVAIVKILGKNLVAGTGFLVSEKHLITCAHVVAYGLGIKSNQVEPPTETIDIQFHFINEINANQLSKAKAKVKAWHPVNKKKSIEDIAVLELIDPLPQGARPISLISSYGELNDHEFTTIGFPPKNPEKPEDGSEGARTAGIIRGKSSEKWIQIEKIREQGYPLEPGFSGAPIWDKQWHGVVGMAVARDVNRLDAQVGFIIPLEKLVEAWPELKEIGNWRGRKKEQELIHLLTPHLADIQTAINWAYRQQSGKIPKKEGRTIPESVAEIVQELSRIQLTEPAAQNLLDKFSIDLYIYLDKSNASVPIYDSLQTWIETNVESWEELRKKRLKHYEVLEKYQRCLLIAIYDHNNSYQGKVWLIEDAENYQSVFWEKSPILIDNQTFFVDRNSLDLGDIAKYIKEGLLLAEPYCLSKPEKIQLFLPDNLCVDNIDACVINEDTEDKLGMNYEVSIRLTKRLQAENEAIQLWRYKGKEMKNSRDKRCAEIFTSVKLEEVKPSLRKKWRKLLHVFALSILNPVSQTSSKKKELVDILFETGIPISLWIRQNQLNEADLAQNLDKCLGNDCCLNHLPARVKEQRLDAFGEDEDGENSHIGHHLSLFWDDPDLVPPKSQLKMP